MLCIIQTGSHQRSTTKAPTPLDLHQTPVATLLGQEISTTLDLTLAPALHLVTDINEIAANPLPRDPIITTATAPAEMTPRTDTTRTNDKETPRAATRTKKTPETDETAPIPANAITAAENLTAATILVPHHVSRTIQKTPMQGSEGRHVPAQYS